MRILQPKKYKLKPPAFASIDWTHSLCQQLKVCIPFNEYGGLPRELVTGLKFSATNLNWGTSQVYGPGQKSDNAANKWIQLTPDSRITGFAPLPITLCAYGNITVAPNAVFHVPFGLMDSGTTGGGRWVLKVNSSNQWSFTGPSAGTTNSTFTPTVGAYFICVSWDGANIRYFYNGAMQTVANANTANAVVGASLWVGGDNNSSAQSNSPWLGSVCGAMVWSRALSFTEMQQLYTNTWQIFCPPRAMGGLSKSYVPDRHLRQQEPHVLVRM